MHKFLSPASVLIHFSCVSTQAIEGEAISFIDQSFKTLRSASAAFDMLMKFKHIRSRDTINNHLMRKFNDILAQYHKEVLQYEIKKCWVVKTKFRNYCTFIISLRYLNKQYVVLLYQYGIL